MLNEMGKALSAKRSKSDCSSDRRLCDKLALKI